MFEFVGRKWKRRGRGENGRANWLFSTFFSGTMWLLLFSWCLGLTVEAAESGSPAQQAPEYQLKAAILAQLPLFTDWPTNHPVNVRSRITLGLLGDDPFGPDGQDVLVKTSRARGYKIQVRQLKSPEEALDCQVVFVSRSAREEVPRLLEILRGKRVLTVADLDGFVSMGGMVNFVIARDRLRLELNLKAADEAGLSLKSSLYGLAVPKGIIQKNGTRK